MALDINSLAAAVGVGIRNVQFLPVAEVLQRKILIMGEYDTSGHPEIETYKLYQVFSAQDVGDRFGFGNVLHRLSIAAYTGSQGIETWVLPLQQEPANGPGGVRAAGSISFTVGTLQSGYVYLYISGQRLIVPIQSSYSAADIAGVVTAAINNDFTLPVTASQASNVVNILAKSRSIWGNYVDVSFNWGLGEELPSGLSATITPLSGGNGVDIFTTALEALGSGDDQNEQYFTDVIVPYPIPITFHIDALSTWNGIGNDFVGNYSKLIQRPVRSLTGDTTPGSTGLSDLIFEADSRRLDRTNGVIAVPGSPNHPSEIAALAIGNMARINNSNAAESYVDILLQGVIPGVPADRWNAGYDERDTAVKNGISPTKVVNGSVYMQNVMTFYRPENVPPSSNGYRSQRNISVMQNVSNSIKVNFDQDKWKRNSIVLDVTKVTNAFARQKVKDIVAVQNDIISLAKQWESLSWIFSAEFTISEIKKGNYVEIRKGGTGFNISIPIILSGESWILDNVVLADTALTVFIQ